MHLPGSIMDRLTMLTVRNTTRLRITRGRTAEERPARRKEESRNQITQNRPSRPNSLIRPTAPTSLR